MPYEKRNAFRADSYSIRLSHLLFIRGVTEDVFFDFESDDEWSLLAEDGVCQRSCRVDGSCYEGPLRAHLGSLILPGESLFSLKETLKSAVRASAIGTLRTLRFTSSLVSSRVSR